MATSKKDEAGVEPGKEVVDWEKRMAGEAKEAAAVERPQVANISLRSGVMTYQGQPIPDNTIDCVIVCAAFEHRWYSKGFDPNNIQAPECFALNTNGEEMAPHANSTEVQSPRCGDCDKFKWGSGTGRGKACGEIRRLMILPTTELTPEAIARAECAMLKVSVTNVKHWANYVNKLTATYSRPTWAVITNISVAPDPKSQFKISFDERELIKDSELLAAIDGRRSQLESLALAPYDPAGNAEAAEPKDDTKY